MNRPRVMWSGRVYRSGACPREASGSRCPARSACEAGTIACLADVDGAEPLTMEELDVLDRLAEAWAAFVALPRCHPTELSEGTEAVHVLQLLVMVRAAVRAYPDRFTHVEGFE